MPSSHDTIAHEERRERLRFRDWRFRVRDILAALHAIARYTEGMEYEDFLADDRTRDAVIRNLTTMGESVRWIPGPVLDAHPEVPWQDMRAVRNVVVHEYFGVDPAVLWQTVRGDLPPLVPLLEGVLAPGQAADAPRGPAGQRGSGDRRGRER